MIFLSLTARLEINVSLILLLFLFFCLDDYFPFRVEKSNFCQETCKREREKPKAKSQGNEGGGSGNSVRTKKSFDLGFSDSIKMISSSASGRQTVIQMKSTSTR